MPKKKDDFVVISALGDTINWEKPGQQFVGTYQSVEKEIGKFNSNLYTFTDDKDDKEIKIWGSAALDPTFLLLKKGDRIRLTFLGIQKIQGGNKVKRFKIEGSASVMERVEKAGILYKPKKGKKGNKK